jgi:hypothetical protein
MEESGKYTNDDMLLSHVSEALSDHTMLPRMISAIQVESAQSVGMLTSKTRHSAVSPEELSRKWRIGLETARNTLKATTQYGVRHATNPLRRRYRTDLLLTKYRRLNSTFYTDMMFSKFKSLNGHSCAQVFCSDDIIQVYPLSTKAHAYRALQSFVDEIGIPNKLVLDGAGEQVGPKSEFVSITHKLHIPLKQTEAYTPRQNRAEFVIGELKRRWRSNLANKDVPKRLWDYGIIYEAEILSRIARGPDGRTGIERVTGETPDISEWLDFGFYDLVWYWDDPNSKDDSKKATIGRWLGISHHIGSNMCYWILTKAGRVISRTTVQHVTDLEVQTIEIRQKVTQCDDVIKIKIE